MKSAPAALPAWAQVNARGRMEDPATVSRGLPFKKRHEKAHDIVPWVCPPPLTLLPKLASPLPHCLSPSTLPPSPAEQQRTVGKQRQDSGGTAERQRSGRADE